jgi:hypothetical protein
MCRYPCATVARAFFIARNPLVVITSQPRHLTNPSTPAHTPAEIVAPTAPPWWLAFGAARPDQPRVKPMVKPETRRANRRHSAPIHAAIPRRFTTPFRVPLPPLPPTPRSSPRQSPLASAPLACSGRPAAEPRPPQPVPNGGPPAPRWRLTPRPAQVFYATSRLGLFEVMRDALAKYRWPAAPPPPPP